MYVRLASARELGRLRAQYGPAVPPRAEYVNPLTRPLQRVGAWLRQHPELSDGVMFLAEQLATPAG